MSTIKTLVVLPHQSGAFVGELFGQDADEISVIGLCHLESNEHGDWYLVPAAIPVGIEEHGLDTATTVFQKANVGSVTLIEYSPASTLWEMFLRKWAPVELAVQEETSTEDVEPAAE